MDVTKEKTAIALKTLMLNGYLLNRPTFTVFVDYSGHVNEVALRIFYGGWKENRDTEVKEGFNISLDKEKNRAAINSFAGVELLNEFLLYADKQWQEHEIATLRKNMPKKFLPLFTNILDFT